MLFRIFFLIFLLPSTVLASDLLITRINPAGEDVASERQIVFEFNKPVVPIGRMERTAQEIPIKITPAVNCEWRWLNTTSLACQLNEKDQLKQATRYKIRIKPNFIAADGSKLTNKIEHTFITQRPILKYTWFNTWKAPGWPVILVSFNQKVNLDSVSDHLFFESSNSTRYNLKAKIGEGYSEQYLLLEPEYELPEDTHFSLNIEPGLLGVEPGEAGIESRKIVEFDSFGKFKFIGIRCYDNKQNQVLITSEVSTDRCNPTAHFEIVFSSPVVKEELEKSVVITPDLAGGRKDIDPWEHVYSYSSLSQPHDSNNDYGLRIPVLLKAFDTYQIKLEANSVKDEFGRELTEPVSLKFNTDHRPAKYVFESSLAVLEKDVATDVPIFVTNIDKLNLKYNFITSENVVHSGEKSFVLDKIQDISYLQNIELREILTKKSGLVWGTFDTEPSLYQPRWFFNQVTPYQVHAKLGHFNSLVWVTDLKNGQAIEGANVELYASSLVNGVSAQRQTKVIARTDLNGLASLPGLEKLDPELALLNKWDLTDLRLFVRIQKGDDLAFLPIHYDFLSYPYGTYSESTKKYGHLKTWGTTAQGVYRAGDTIDYKLYVRNQNTNSFSAAPSGNYKLEIIDPLGKTVSTVDDLKLNEFGAYDGALRLSENAAVGWYRFQLSSDFTDYKWQAFNVLVSDFTPSPFKVSNELNGKIFEVEQDITVSTLAKLHSGGPYLEAPVRITANLTPENFNPIEGYDFTYLDGFYPRTVYSFETKLNDLGELDQDFSISNDNVPVYGNISVESAVKDDRGKFVATTTSAKFHSRDRFVGLKLDSWVIEKDKPTKVESIVVDQNGEIQTGSIIEIQIERHEVKASRVKGAGNAYLTKYMEEWTPEDNCKLFSTAKAQACTFVPKGIGSYRISGKILDTKDREHISTIFRWSTGEGQALWDTGSENKLEIVAEKNEYKLGDRAKFLIKNPFPGASALFSIERYGIIKSWTAVLKNSSEVIEFDIEKDHLPGIYFSAVVMSPRVADAPIEADVDLGKPTFRMGYATINVEDDSKRIKLDVSSEKQTYQPREDVTVELKLNSSDIKSSEVELAVAVLDEAVFDLVQGGSKYFDPYLGFYNLDPLDVANYNILKQLIGLRKIEKKGANAGGDGGKSSENRNIFKYVSYWNPSLKFDSTGKTKIKFTAPDNLTGWRVLALAVNKTDRMGLGQANFKVNKETEIRPANPNQVTEGDSFVSKFTVMNRSDKTRTLKVVLQASGPIEATKPFSLEVTAEPYKRTLVSIPITATQVGSVKIEASANDEIGQDGLTVEIPVHRRSVLQAAANYGSTTEDNVSEDIVFPNNMREDQGRVSVVLSPSVISSLEGAFKYLRDYPYLCWEQRITKAAAAMQYLALKQYLPKDFVWADAEKVILTTLEQAQTFQAPNGGMTFYVAQDQYVSPYLSAYTAIAFNWLNKAGYKIPKQVQDKLDLYLLELLRKDVVPDFYSEGMSSSVRAVALAALSNSKKLTLDDITRYQQHLPQMSLFAKAHYLQAVNSFKNKDLEKLILDKILSHANESGGKFSFLETLDTNFARIMESSLKTNCAVLSTLLKQNELNQDIPAKLVRFLTQSREKKIHWENTQENIFCLNALTEFSKKYESQKPNYKYTVSIDQQKRGDGKFTSFRDPAVEMDLAIKKGDKGRSIKAEVVKQGPGRMYYATRLFYSPENPGVSSINSGIEVRREYSVERNGKFELLEESDQVKQGELVKVDLFLSLPAARNFVVVDDPIPGGLEPVNTDLATASTVDANKADYIYAQASFWYEHRDWQLFGSSFWSFYHKELRHDSARFYSEYLPKGNYHLSYTAQAIASGKFIVMPTHTEEMYDPDVFGETKSSVLEIVE